MSVLINTNVVSFYVDLCTIECPLTCSHFFDLCWSHHYKNGTFFLIEKDIIATTNNYPIGDDPIEIDHTSAGTLGMLGESEHSKSENSENLKSDRTRKDSDPRFHPVLFSASPRSIGFFSALMEETQLRDIPMDAVMEIFARVPARTVASCRSVSKQWRSMIGRPEFKELFLAVSWTRPRLLLFTFQSDGKIFNFSSPQPQNRHHKTSLVLTRYHVHHNHYSTDFGSPVGGFICRRDRDDEGVSMVICNPVTGESVSLPKVESINGFETIPFLGYDPIDKQFKVLCIETCGASNTHHILTLENGNHLWRAIQCKRHFIFPKSKGICIDGVLYYTAGVKPLPWVPMIVCFDIRSEKFNFISTDDDEATRMTSRSTLINYKGKLGVLQLSYPCPKRLVLWVLEDAVKCKWSKTTYTFSFFARKFFNRTDIAIVGMAGKGEVVLSPICLSDPLPFYIYYYNLESDRFTRVRIQGLEGFKRNKVYTSIVYAENLKLMTEYGKGVKSNTFSPK